MNIKERYLRFKEWQRNPFHYRNKNLNTVRCANCGEEFASNYCPMCGQKADVGRVSWKTVRQSVSLLWGLESRSLGYTLLQLLLRPGYLIGDYISGRRQVSFPPVKMLFILAIFATVIERLSGENHVEDPATATTFIDRAFDWFYENPAWGILCITSFVIIPTLFLFRHAPRHSRHTIPEGFFIQVFMATIVTIFACMTSIAEWLEWGIYVYYVIAYQQLFGYKFWGTLWRTIACLVVGFILFALTIKVIALFVDGGFHLSQGQIIVAAATVVLFPLAHIINMRSAKKRQQD